MTARASTEPCDTHELIGCDWCATKTVGGKVRRPEGAEAGASFEARYPGVCEAGDRIEPGDRVRYVEGYLVHTDCEDR